MKALIAICLAACGMLFGQQAAPLDPQEAVLKAEAAMTKAWDAGDTATVSRLIADDFRGVGSRGRVLAKAEMVKAVASVQGGSTQVAQERVALFGSAAVYTALVTDHLKTPQGKSLTIRTRVTDIWANRDNVWQLVASQETEVKD